MKISASIVIYQNNQQELRQAIRSCLASPLVGCLYLIDNSPAPHYTERENDSRIIYIHNAKNIGFGAAHNIAIARLAGQSDYHLVLNPDVCFEAPVIEELAHFMEANRSVGQVMPKILYKNGDIQRLCKLLPSPLNLFGRRFAGSISWFKKLDDRYELRQFTYNEIADIPNLSGCFMFIRTSVLEQVKGFDPRYFLYLEDVDLVRRIGQVSRTVYYPHVSVIHGYEKASYGKGRLFRIHLQSAIKYFNKWGWFLDQERRRKNQETISRLRIDQEKNLSSQAG